MKKETIDLLNKISNDDLFKNNEFVLIGGTALSIHLKHRLSEDLDFMLLKKNRLPENDIIRFVAKYNATFIPFNYYEQEKMINEGGNINDYQQRYKIDGVKIEFIINLGNILEQDIVNNNNKVHYKNNIYIASINSIFEMKSLLLMDRNKIRDLFDLYILLEKYNYTIKDVLNTIKKYRITYTDEDILRWIENKKSDEKDTTDESLDGLTKQPPSKKELINYFTKKIEDEIIEQTALNIKNNTLKKKNKKKDLNLCT